MAVLQSAFDATQHNPSQGTGQLPCGVLDVVIANSDITSTKNGGSGLIKFELRVVSGDNEGATGTWLINLYNASAQTREIAEREFSALCHVTGVLSLNDTAALHNIPFKVEVHPDKSNADKFTRVTRVYDASGVGPAGNGRAPEHAAVVKMSEKEKADFIAAHNSANGIPQTVSVAAVAQPAAGGWGSQAAQAPAQQPAQQPVQQPAQPAQPAQAQQPANNGWGAPATQPTQTVAAPQAPAQPAQQPATPFTQQPATPTAPWQQQ